MAISGGDGSIILTTKVDESGLKRGLGKISGFAKTAAKGFSVIGAAAAAATVAITKMATDAYADYEQLVGGVETLFKGSSKKVLEYANEAYRTTGQSANEYMQNVTAFSASLLSAVGGDTEKAAEVANAAMISISDNVNKMGSSAESVQLAFQGFAKQQYMLLDNLKLGYGGTKTEMERLLKDAQAITGVEYNIDNLADVYTAIGVIQEKLGIAGTTAKEASTTISGSAATMKAAWNNVLSAIAGGGDLGKAIENLVSSIGTYFENIVPVIERSLQGIGQLIAKVAPMLVQTVVKSLIQSIPSLLDAVYQMIIGLAKGIYEGIIALFSGETVKTVEKQTNQIAKSVENQNDLTKAVEETEKAQKGALAGFDEINTLTKGASEPQMENLGNFSVGGIVSNDDVKVTKKAKKEFGAFGKILGILKDALEPLQKISLQNLSVSLDNLMTSLQPYANLVLEGLRWLWFDVLVPMSQWTIENLIPAFLDTISAALGLLTPILEAIQPTLSWLWDSILVPMASFVGDLFLDFLNLLTEAFTKLSDWAKNNQSTLENISTVVLGFLAGIWIYNSAKKLIDFCKNLGSAFVTLGNKMAEGGLKGAFMAASVGILAAGIITLAKNWDKMTPAQRVITILGALAAAATAAAIAIAIFHTAWTIGIAAAAIAGGLALLGLTFAFTDSGDTGDAAEKAADNFYSSYDWDKEFSLPKLATGTVVPPNREFMAILGDNKREPEIVSPLSTMKRAVAEVLAEANIGGGYNGRIEVPVIIDGREVARAVREAESNMGSQTVFGGFANVY